MARVRDARTTRAGTHTQRSHTKPVCRHGPRSVMQGSGMGAGGGGAPQARRQAGRAYARPPAVTRAEDPHAVAKLEGEPLCQRTRDALAVEAAE
eukprot:4742349-Prymnesium_polylepis.1